jgi:ABC-type glutathione transport system ATPase component
MTDIVEIRDLTVLFGGTRGWLRRAAPPVHAVGGISLSIKQGEIVGLVGESGCGKTTLGRTLLGLQRETGGEIRLDGGIVSGLPSPAARRRRQAIHYVHQDAAAAPDPWWGVGHTLEEGLKIHGVTSAAERRARVDEVLNAVGLDPLVRVRYPHELKGGRTEPLSSQRADRNHVRGGPRPISTLRVRRIISVVPLNASSSPAGHLDSAHPSCKFGRK